MNRPPRGDEEDWQCVVCRDTQFARNDKCRKCGAPRPSNDASVAALQNALLSSSRGGGGGAGALALGNSKEPSNSDWSCPKCRDMNFGTRASCRSCHTPRPHNPMEALHRAVKGASTQSIAMLNGAGAGVPSMGHASGAVGFIPAHANPVSSWQNMWNGETPNGMLVGEKLPDWMLAKSDPGGSSDSESGSSDGSSSSSSSGSGSGSGSEEGGKKGKAEGGKKEDKAKKGEGGKENKKKVPKTAAEKREERKRKAEAERERRKEQAERRKKRIVSLD